MQDCRVRTLAPTGCSKTRPMGFTIAPMRYQSPRIDLEALLEKARGGKCRVRCKTYH
jgi:hypothetical protein